MGRCRPRGVSLNLTIATHPPGSLGSFQRNPGARRRQALLLQKNKGFIRFLFWWWWILGAPLVILRGVLPALRLRMSPGHARATGLGCQSLNTSRLLARQAGLDHSGLSDSCFDNFFSGLVQSVGWFLTFLLGFPPWETRSGMHTCVYIHTHTSMQCSHFILNLGDKGSLVLWTQRDFGRWDYRS